ncbi:hypothetical protein GCM10029992_11760 [Glycomyces albus]
MLRAARFAAQLDFAIEADTLRAMTDMAAELERITAERIRDEFAKLMLAPDPVVGIRVLVETGLAERFVPEVPAMRMEIDEHAQHKDVYEHSCRCCATPSVSRTARRTWSCGWPRSCTTSANRTPRASPGTGASPSTTTTWSGPAWPAP